MYHLATIHFITDRWTITQTMTFTMTIADQKRIRPIHWHIFYPMQPTYPAQFITQKAYNSLFETRHLHRTKLSSLIDGSTLELSSD